MSRRIACLTPSATDICILLGLKEDIVGVTHECDYNEAGVVILTRDGLADTKSQIEIHKRVKDNSEKAIACSLSSSSLLVQENELYPVNWDDLKSIEPTLIITQDLCRVCAPSPNTLLYEHFSSHSNSKGPDKNTEILALSPHTLKEILETIMQVANASNIGDVGRVIRDRLESQVKALMEITKSYFTSSGVKKRERKTMQCKYVWCLRDSISFHSTFSRSYYFFNSFFLPHIKIIVLEWLDPPFNAGHWLPEMMHCVNIIPVSSQKGSNDNSVKSREITWNDVYDTKCDVILVACCGFDLQRNIEDCYSQEKFLKKTKDVDIYATDGNQYFARPSFAKLLTGMIIMIYCAYHEDEPELISQIEKLDFVEKNEIQKYYKKIDFSSKNEQQHEAEELVDIEDWITVHKRACDENKMFYKDPKTGYSVFTKLAHLKRGKCCGSGCRHCPYAHENVKDKAKYIQQPAILYEQKTSSNNKNQNELFSLKTCLNIKVLFFSGGKDSFLTIRALARQAKVQPFGLILLTTFDATSRVIAHQEMSIEVVIKQAKHLNITLVGIPLHRQSAHSDNYYLGRVKKAISLIHSKYCNSQKDNVKRCIASLVFGDLHLEHIREWRKQQLTHENIIGNDSRIDHDDERIQEIVDTLPKYELEFPLWNVPYNQLEKDLEASGVQCVVSSVSALEDHVPCLRSIGINVGDLYDTNFRSQIQSYNERVISEKEIMIKQVDVFGECGEFHTEAKVWCVQREQALGIL